MSTAAVLVDDWKLAAFKKHLDGAGFQYTEQMFMEGVTMLKVGYSPEDMERLQETVEAAQKETAQ